MARNWRSRTDSLSSLTYSMSTNCCLPQVSQQSHVSSLRANHVACPLSPRRVQHQAGWGCSPKLLLVLSTGMGHRFSGSLALVELAAFSCLPWWLIVSPVCPVLMRTASGGFGVEVFWSCFFNMNTTKFRMAFKFKFCCSRFIMSQCFPSLFLHLET